LHQGATFTITEKPAMPPEMWIPLLIMVLGFYCFFSVVLMGHARVELLEREKRSDWVKQLIERY
jgi:heme exporter protein C